MITIVDIGPKFNYKVPSFSVIDVELREATIQVVECGRVATFGVFVKADSTLEKRTPFCLLLESHCIVPVAEFSKAATRSSLLLSEGVVIIWEWSFPDVDENDDEEVDVDSVCSAEGEQSGTGISSDENDVETVETDTVVFKCIGVTRDTFYQNTLSEAALMFGEGRNIPVRLTPEPNNRFDSHAVSFQCNVGSGWHVIGYVVKELCLNVLEALNANLVLSTKFEWIKYKVMPSSGPGYYAAIAVTKKGKWSINVHSLRITMH